MKKKSISPRYYLAAVAFTGVTITAVMFSCNLYRVLPLYVSLIVMILQTRANRLSFVVGGLNAAYYAVVYFTLKLYGLALYSLLIACPLQLITWLRWRKNPYAQATVLRRLSAKERTFWLLGLFGAWAALYFVLDAFGSGYLVLDNTISIISTAGNLGSLFSLIEFPFMQILAHVLNITLYIRMISEDPKQWTYLIYSVYALACSCISAYYMHRLYLQQQGLGEHR